MKTPTLFLAFLSSVEQENKEIGMPKQDKPSFQRICSNTYSLNYFDMVPVLQLLLLLSYFYIQHAVFYHFKFLK